VARTLVLGVGNVLLCDDGAGVHAMRALASEQGDVPDVEYLDGGTLSFTLAPAIEGVERLIVFDATQLSSPAGTVRCLVDREMDAFLGRAKRSVHEVGLLDLLDIARLTGFLPHQRALIGIQPARIDWGDTPTDAVTKGIRQAVQIGTGLLQQWPAAANAG